MPPEERDFGVLFADITTPTLSLPQSPAQTRQGKLCALDGPWALMGNKMATPHSSSSRCGSVGSFWVILCLLMRNHAEEFWLFSFVCLCHSLKTFNLETLLGLNSCLVGFSLLCDSLWPGLGEVTLGIQGGYQVPGGRRRCWKDRVGVQEWRRPETRNSFTIWPGAVPMIGCLSQECPQNSKSFLDAVFLSCVK